MRVTSKIVWEACKYSWTEIFREYGPYKRLILSSLWVDVAGLAFPALVASHKIPLNAVTIALAALAFMWIWYNAVFSGARAMMGIYIYPVGSLVLVESEEEKRQHLPYRTIMRVAISFAFTIYGFAIAYAFLSEWVPKSFNVGKLGIFSSLYFSLTTIATVGFGDIFPVSRVARLLVMCEIVSGMLYAIFIFSIIASFVKERH